MSDIQKPTVLNLLAVLALITGVFSSIRGGLMIFGGISQIIGDVGGVFEIIIGVASLGVGVIAFISGIKVLWDRAGGIAIIKMYAIGLIGYNVLWVVYTVAAGGKVSWLSVVSELVIGAATIALIMTNEEVSKYSESLG
ncbi:MAG: hypothetical protein A2176_05110 [Spirochaetes bacterium RBG_13_51_14]|nr:MAG: hypothetical protein A2176_05110 [Spirochaetes bacterium RBG_13_51_14]